MNGAPSDAALELPVRFGRYLLYEVLGTGGMARVYGAELCGPAGFRKPVALKVLHPHTQERAGSQEELIHEARLSARLKHRHIVDVYELGHHDGCPFVAMEVVDGLSLREALAQGAPPASVVVDIGLALAGALAHAHQHQLHGQSAPIVHRDVKPENVLLGTDGTVKLTDFGIAHRIEPADGKDGNQGHRPRMMGTPGYMSPEQARGEDTGPGSDVFSLGIVLYELGTGQQLFQATDPTGAAVEMLSMVSRSGELDRSISAVDAKVPGLGPIVRSCLRLAPDDRPADGAEVALRLRDLRTRLPPQPDVEEWLAVVLAAEAMGRGSSRPVAPITPVTVGETIPPTWDSGGERPWFAELEQLGTAEELSLRLDEKSGTEGFPPESVDWSGERQCLTMVCRGTLPCLLMEEESSGFWMGGQLLLRCRRGSIGDRLLRTIAIRGAHLDREALFSEVWQQPYRPPSSDNALYVGIHRLRGRLADTPLDIESEGDGGYVIGCRPAVFSWRKSLRTTGGRAEDAGVSGGAIEVRTTNVTPMEDRFIGRERDLAALDDLLSEQSRLVTLTGPPGTGKTRLARRFALRFLEKHTEEPGRVGTWFCDLTASTSGPGVIRAVAEALGLQLGKGGENPQAQHIETIGHAMGGRGRALVILDNAEQVADVVGPIVEQWLVLAPAARILVTSRVPLRIAAESRMALAPLAVPPSDQQTLAEIEACPAVALLAARARAVVPDFRVDDGNRDDVAALVRELDGLPLAIELAAARLPVLSVADLRTRLASRFEVLRRQRLGDSPRLATLRGAIDLSWELLEPWEQGALAQLSVFAGGFCLPDAEAVVDLSPWPDAPWLVDVVQSLLESSVLVVTDEGEAPRFGMLMSIRQYAAEKLGEETAATVLRHAEHFGSFGDEAFIASLHTHGGVKRQADLLMELENLVAGVEGALAAGEPEVAAGCALAAAALFRLYGPYSDGAALLQRLAGRAVRPGTRAGLLCQTGRLLYSGGSTTEAMECFHQGLVLAREVGNRRYEGIILASRARQLGDQGQFSDALESYRQALVIAREVGDHLYECIILGRLAGLHLAQGRYSEALEHYHQSLVISREVGNRRSEGITLGGLAVLDNKQGHIAEALEHSRQALVIAREVGNRRSEGLTLGNLANILRVQGRTAEALEHSRRALAIGRELGDQRYVGATLGNLGDLLFAQGDLTAAEARLRQAIAIGDKTWVVTSGVFRGSLALIRAHQGAFDEARTLLSEGDARLRDVYTLELGKLICKKARVEHLAGDPDAAAAALAEADGIATDLGGGSDSELASVVSETREFLAR